LTALGIGLVGVARRQLKKVAYRCRDQSTHPTEMAAGLWGSGIVTSMRVPGSPAPEMRNAPPRR
jgi:hypothetical protein